MENELKKFVIKRQDMIENQIVARGINDKAILDAINDIPRHLFVDSTLIDSAYEDYPLLIGEGQTISQPYIIALMTKHLEIQKNEKVLEIGTGSGYQAAVLAKLSYKVYTVERKISLLLKAKKLFDQLKLHNIVTKYTDGTLGWKEKSPFDAIIVTAGGQKVPEPLIEQLSIGGRLIMPVGDSSSQVLMKIERTKNKLISTNLGQCRFVKLIGQHGWDE